MIKKIEPKDYEFVLRSNRENAAVLIPLEKEGLVFLVDTAELFGVMYKAGNPVGYIIALREGIENYDYKSYKWFGERCSEFLYIDQIVIDKKYRGQGFGSRLYQYAFEHAKKTGIGIIAAAIAEDNKASLEFHAKMGFSEIGKQSVRGGSIKLSQQIKKIIV